MESGLSYKVDVARLPLRSLRSSRTERTLIKVNVNVLEQKCKDHAMRLQGKKKIFSYVEVREGFTIERTLEQRLD